MSHHNKNFEQESRLTMYNNPNSFNSAVYMRIDLKILVFLAIIVAAALVFYKSWDFALADPDEARYAETSREMIEQKSYSIPLFNYEPRLNKPILFYWCQIVSFKLFGVNEFAARLPSGLAGLATMVLVFLIGNLLFDRDQALLSLFIFTTSIFFLIFARAGILEIFLLLTFTLSIYFFLMAENSFLNWKGRKKTFYVSLFFISLGLSFLVKGPVGVLVPLLIIATYLILMRRFSPFSIINLMFGAFLFLSVLAPWGLTLIYHVGLPRILNILERETIERYFVGFDHPGSFYFYIPIMLAGFFPWSSFLPVAAWRLGKTAFKNWNREKIFLLIWLIFPLIFFSFSGSKLPGYILPVLPAASIIVASGWHEEKRKLHGEIPGEDKKTRGWFFFSGYIILLLCFLLFWIYGFFAIDKYPVFRAFYFSVSWLGALLLLIFLIFLVLKKHALLFFSVVMFFISFAIFGILLFMPILVDMRSTKRLVLDKLVDYPDRSLCTYNQEIPSLIFYTQQKVKLIWGKENLENMIQGEAEVLVIMSEGNYTGLPSALKRQLKREGEVGKLILLIPSKPTLP
jgi:hypothetical protein